MNQYEEEEVVAVQEKEDKGVDDNKKQRLKGRGKVIVSMREVEVRRGEESLYLVFCQLEYSNISYIATNIEPCK